jgi:hypothetical protein
VSPERALHTDALSCMMPAHVQQHDQLRTALSLLTLQQGADPNDVWVCSLLEGQRRPTLIIAAQHSPAPVTPTMPTTARGLSRSTVYYSVASS